MKTIRIKIDKWLDSQDKSWRALSLDRQRSYTVCLFMAYLLLTAVVVLKVWYDMAKCDSRIVIEQMGNPVRKKESPAPPNERAINNSKRKDL